MNISRDAIVIYLNNMRIIETIIYLSEQKLKELQNDLRIQEDNIRKLDNESKLSVKRTDESPAAHAIYGAFAGFFVGAIAALFIIGPGDIISGLFELICGEFETLFKVLGFLAGGVILGAIVGACVQNSLNKDNQQKNIQYRNDVINDLDKEKADYNRRKPLMDKQIRDLKNQIQVFDELRGEGYALNIVPYSSNINQNVRTLHGVLFLYEYMSSSREELRDALVHYKLGEIINRLDTLISMVENVISNQNAMLSNQAKMLQSLKANEQRLENIQEYSEIIAHNSNLQTQMQRESLYYQRVRYFRDL